MIDSHLAGHPSSLEAKLLLPLNDALHVAECLPDHVIMYLIGLSLIILEAQLGVAFHKGVPLLLLPYVLSQLHVILYAVLRHQG